MIIQACINGIRDADFHPKVPLTPRAMVEDAHACILFGAGEIHVHPRDLQGTESLTAVDDTVAAIRRRCPGTLIGVSTGQWIENDIQRTRKCIREWKEFPDYASVNLYEYDALNVMDLLLAKGVGIEAGLASASDAERLASYENCGKVFRVLIEIEEQDIGEATSLAESIESVLRERKLNRPILLHGTDNTVWPLAKLAFQRGFSTRIGLEDGKLMPDGELAKDNAALIKAATKLLRNN